MADSNYWFKLDSEVVTDDDYDIVLVFADSAGNGVDISAWTFYYHCKSLDSSNSDTITVADGSMSKSNSGSGVTDTVTIPLAQAATDAMAKGKYLQEIKVVKNSKNYTIARGTIKFADKVVTIT
jgi:hypothetical protein